MDDVKKLATYFPQGKSRPRIDGVDGHNLVVPILPNRQESLESVEYFSAEEEFSLEESSLASTAHVTMAPSVSKGVATDIIDAALQRAQRRDVDEKKCKSFSRLRIVSNEKRNEMIEQMTLAIHGREHHLLKGDVKEQIIEAVSHTLEAKNKKLTTIKMVAKALIGKKQSSHDTKRFTKENMRIANCMDYVIHEYSPVRAFLDQLEEGANAVLEKDALQLQQISERGRCF